mmetsp:Transcript_6517/g.27786  ORF Transcript_6517/g.27786 Transcript_6517/m.27786 type:complete len:227 (+) Transcript_6517:335-1015(+)
MRRGDIALGDARALPGLLFPPGAGDPEGVASGVSIAASSRFASVSSVVASSASSMNATSVASPSSVNATRDSLSGLLRGPASPPGDGAGDTVAPQPGNILNGERSATACFASSPSQYSSYASRSNEPSESYDEYDEYERAEPESASASESDAESESEDASRLDAPLSSSFSSSASSTGDGGRFGGISDGGAVSSALRRRRVMSAVLGRARSALAAAPAPAPPSCCR